MQKIVINNCNFIIQFNNITLLTLLIIVVALLSKSSCSSSNAMDPTTAVLIRVDPSGRGDFRNIQDAIDFVPPNNSEFVFIWIKPGYYREKIVVPENKPYITLSGSRSRAMNTIITWDDGHDSSTLSVFSSYFVARYLTIQNTFGERGKGVALRVLGDKAAFYACRILSYQDTILDAVGRHYYRNCYIQGATDFICGNAASLFEKCHMHSLVSYGNGAITAQKRKTAWENTGFVFLGCKITGIGVGTTLLGRPWGPFSRVIYALTYMSHTVSPKGWDNWRDPNKERSVFYGEFKNYGQGANRARRVKWSKSLTIEEVAPFLTNYGMIGGRRWLRQTPTRFKRYFSPNFEINV